MMKRLLIGLTCNFRLACHKVLSITAALIGILQLMQPM